MADPSGRTFYTAFLSIGSNKEDKAGNLDKAVRHLDGLDDIEVAAVSGFYRTEPTDFLDQDWFVNAALEIKTPVEDPQRLLEILKQAEQSLDPEGKDFRFGPRRVDLDIIYFETRVLKTDTLEIPHPRMHERNFVLRPLCDLIPSAIHPVFKKTTRDLMKIIEHEEGQAVFPLA